MSYRDALKVFKLERGLNDDETAFLNTLRAMSESERELLVESLSPQSKRPVKKAASNVRCKAELLDGSTCHMVKSHSIHDKDNYEPNAHRFLETTSKPRRRTGISDAIKGTAGAAGRAVEVGGFADDADMVVRCSDCGAIADDNVHHRRTDPNYHPFLDGLPALAAVGQSSSKNGEGVRSEASSETGTEGVSNAVHAGG